MDEDKTFDLLTQIYGEFKEFRKDMNEFRKETNGRLDKLESGQKKINVTLENDIKSKIQFLHEREADNTVKLEEHGKQLAEINNKLDYLALSVNSQDKRLEVVESFKRKKAK